MLPSLSPPDSLVHENPSDESDGSDARTSDEPSDESDEAFRVSDESDPSRRDSEGHHAQDMESSSSESLDDEEDSSENASGDEGLGFGEMFQDLRGMTGPEDDAIFWQARKCPELYMAEWALANSHPPFLYRK